MDKKFKEYDKFNLSDINKRVLERWNAESLFEQSMKVREGAPSFVFFEGPPSANGMPGIHHVMARTIKDIFCRYKTMKGFHVKRKAGWDTHGLPVELGVEKSLGITKEDIGKKISVDEYNSACRREVMKYTREWENLTNSMYGGCCRNFTTKDTCTKAIPYSPTLRLPAQALARTSLTSRDATAM